jgi:hypothetical protein
MLYHGALPSPIDTSSAATVLYYKVVDVSPSSSFHCHLNETYNSSALIFATSQKPLTVFTPTYDRYLF